MLSTPRGAPGAGALRRLNTPRPLRVRADAGAAPSALLRGGRWLAAVELLDRYRTDDRWWTSVPVARAYYELLLEDGQVATVFRDEIGGGWWEQRYQ